MGFVDICREDIQMEAVKGYWGDFGGRQRNISSLYM